MNVFAIEGIFSLLVEVILLGVKIYAFVNCLMFSKEHFTAANKMTKPAWAINLAFTIAAFVYLADVRPALASLTRRR